MGWSARQWLALTPEATYGVFNTTASQLWVRLSDSNAFTMRSKALTSTIRSADGGNRRHQRISSRQMVSGSLQTLFYPSQAQALVGFATSLTGYVPQSFTIDHWDSVRARRYLGCLAKGLTIRCAARENDGVASLVFDLLAQQPAAIDPALAEPAISVFPTETPYTHQNSSGLVAIGRTRTKYKSLEVRIKNMLVPTWDESVFPTAIYWAGRDVDWSVAIQYLSPIDRANYETQTPLACSVGWTQLQPAHSALLNFEGTNYIDQLIDDLPLDGAGYQNLLLQSFFDATAATDLTTTIS